MSDLYDRDGIAPRLALTCPSCAAEARFESRYGDHRLPVQVDDGQGGARPSWAGRISCAGCGLDRDHDVDWPEEAFYRIAYRRAELWAWDRSMMEAIRNFIAAGADRDKVRRASPYALELMRLPKDVLSGRARPKVLAKIDACLKR
ncbi:MAG: hypothetical protein CMF74_11480 [Maricaulis sp.]|jgi:hypothetical protein|nr:hypothetical protein [Maricaulis sp.]HAQ35304.1 hypothetical protein [Alphaproteobacteria bacterium]|tara:strand:- start:262 stop:699 length:438 start_codon:yes stop_codon:yes gene_type:complete